MLRSVFTKTIWDRRISIIWWLIGTTVLAAWLIALYPSFRDSEQMLEFIESFPPEMLALFGIDPALYTTGFGYVSAQLYTLIGPLVVIAFAVGAGAGATASEEETGTMDILLSGPISRSRLILEKFGAISFLSSAIVAALIASLLLGNVLVDLSLSIGGVIAANFALLCLGLLFGSVALAVGAWRGRRGLAAAVASGLAVLTWFLNGFAPIVEGLEGIQKFLPFYWYQAGDPLLDGMTASQWLLPAVAALFLGLAVLLFRRRDVRTDQPLIGVVTSSAVGSKPRSIAGGRLSGLLTSVAGKEIWDRRRSIWGWMLGLAGLAALTIAFWPTVRSGGDAATELIGSLPSELLAMFGITDARALLTPEGFLSARLYSTIGTILMLVFAIGFGSSALAGEESNGTADLLLAAPVTRQRVTSEKLVALMALVAFLALGLFVTISVFGPIVDMGLNAGFVAAANIGLALLALLFGTGALAIGAFSGRPSAASGIPAAVAVGAFVLNGLGAAVDVLEPFRVLSPFYWYLADSPPLSHGLSASYLLLASGTVLLGIAAVIGFRRRNVGT